MNKSELLFKHQRNDLSDFEYSQISELLERAVLVCGSEIKKQYETILFKINGQEPDQDENGNKLKASCLNCGTPTEKYLMNKRNYFCCNNCEEEHQKPTLYATDDLKQLADDGIKKLCEGFK